MKRLFVLVALLFAAQGVVQAATKGTILTVINDSPYAAKILLGEAPIGPAKKGESYEQLEDNLSKTMVDKEGNSVPTLIYKDSEDAQQNIEAVVSNRIILPSHFIDMNNKERPIRAVEKGLNIKSYNLPVNIQLITGLTLSPWLEKTSSSQTYKISEKGNKIYLDDVEQKRIADIKNIIIHINPQGNVTLR